MTDPARPTPLTCVWDASALHHVGKAGRLDVLGSFVAGPPNAPWSHVVTDVVVEELERYGLESPSWCEIVSPIELADLIEFAEWANRMSDGIHDLGEASVVAWANRRGLIAVLDDEDAKRVAQRHGCRAHGSLWLLCEAINADLLDVTSASSFVDAVMSVGARFPFARHGFPAWARSRKLLRRP